MNAPPAPRGAPPPGRRFSRAHLAARGTTVATEVRAGVATFLTLAYILVVNPAILAQAGLPEADVLVATALTAAFVTLLAGLWADLPLAFAPGMGINAYFTFGVVHGLGVPWPAALAAVFAAGGLLFVLARTPLRSALVQALPESLKAAIAAGIGLLLAFLGLRGGGLVVGHPETLVALGDLHAPGPLLALAGLLGTGALVARRVPGALLAGVAVLTALAWAFGLAPPPPGVFSTPRLPTATLGALDLTALLDPRLWPVVFAFFLVTLLDTAGTLVGVCRRAGLLLPDGRLPRAGRAFTADALGTMLGAGLGTSPVTAYVESAAGVQEGGRTGLTAVVVAVLLLGALFLAPLLTAVPALATAPALVVVGALMMEDVRHVAWNRFDEALPAFLTVVGMPLTFSIAHGITLGIVSYVVLKALTGQARAVPPLLWGLAALLVLFHAGAG